MSDVNGKIDRIAENKMLAAANRIVVPALLAIMSWLGLQVWQEIKSVGTEVVQIKINQAVQQTTIENLIQRLDRIEAQRGGSLLVPKPTTERQATYPEERDPNG